MPTVQTNLRLESEIKARALAEAERRRIPLNALVEMALEALLDGGVAGDSAVVSDSRPDSTVVSEQIADLIARVKKLEAIAATPPPPSPAVATEGSATGQSSTRARADGDGQQHPRADGQRWLTTGQAWEHCRGLGYGGGKDAFRGWAKRHPADLLRLYGLEATGYSGKSNTTASYRKV